MFVFACGGDTEETQTEIGESLDRIMYVEVKVSFNCEK